MTVVNQGGSSSSILLPYTRICMSSLLSILSYIHRSFCPSSCCYLRWLVCVTISPQCMCIQCIIHQHTIDSAWVSSSKSREVLLRDDMVAPSLHMYVYT